MIVPATVEHVKALYEKIPFSMRGYAIVDGEEVLGLAGYYSPNGLTVLFANITDKGLLRKKELILLSRKVLDMFSGKNIFALEDDVPTSQGVLRHFGFEPIGGGVWHGFR